MANEHKPENDDWSYPSPRKMSDWLEREITDIQEQRRCELKTQQGSLTRTRGGEISADEAGERSYAYSQRWGDVVPGVFGTEGRTDEEIVRILDETRVKQGLISKRRPGGKKDGPPEVSP